MKIYTLKKRRREAKMSDPKSVIGLTFCGFLQNGQLTKVENMTIFILYKIDKNRY